jgi:hypothetical protein
MESLPNDSLGLKQRLVAAEDENAALLGEVHNRNLSILEYQRQQAGLQAELGVWQDLAQRKRVGRSDVITQLATAEATIAEHDAETTIANIRSGVFGQIIDSYHHLRRTVARQQTAVVDSMRRTLSAEQHAHEMEDKAHKAEAETETVRLEMDQLKNDQEQMILEAVEERIRTLQQIYIRDQEALAEEREALQTSESQAWEQVTILRETHTTDADLQEENRKLRESEAGYQVRISELETQVASLSKQPEVPQETIQEAEEVDITADPRYITLQDINKDLTQQAADKDRRILALQGENTKLKRAERLKDTQIESLKGDLQRARGKKRPGFISQILYVVRHPRSIFPQS